MTTRRPLHFRPRRAVAGGYVLLEIIIALTVFAVAVGGLTSVLHASLDSANALRRSAAIRRGLEAMLIEARQKPKREEMALTATDPALGLEYRSSIEEVKWINRRGDPVRQQWGRGFSRLDQSVDNVPRNVQSVGQPSPQVSFPDRKKYV